MTNGSLMKVKSIAEKGAFCNIFDLHKAINGLENHFLVFLRVAVLHRIYCISKSNEWSVTIQHKQLYSKTCVKQPLKNRQNKVLITTDSLMKVKSIAENTFDLH